MHNDGNSLLRTPYTDHLGHELVFEGIGFATLLGSSVELLVEVIYMG